MTNSSAASESSQAAVRTLTRSQAIAIGQHWVTFARPDQLAPEGDWTTWLMLGGRGSGKTRAGAEWVAGLVRQGVTPIALVGQTMTEALAVMARGESGLMRVMRRHRPKLRGTTLVWDNGVEAMLMSASDPDRFRGPQFAAAWCDEVAKWPDAEAAWDMLQFALRLGDRPRQVATTTPRPIPLLKRLLVDEHTAVTRMRTEQNAEFLAPRFLDAVVGRYRGSVLGRQELDGELIEDSPDALWQRSMFRRAGDEPVQRIVVAVDPPVTGGLKSDACGIIVAGGTEAGATVLEDLTLQPASPMGWARRAVAAYRSHGADCIVVEVNQGGDMVKTVIGQVDPDVPVKAVRAMRGKWLRAEPVATLYAQGRVSHAVGLTALEDEMCAFGTDGRSDGHSPDRVDALVWAVTELLLGGQGPRVHAL